MTDGFGKARYDIGPDNQSSCLYFCISDLDELKASLDISLKLADSHYHDLWNEAAQSPGNPDLETIDLFESALGEAPHLNRYFQILRSGAIKDAVTILEVFLEKCADEIAQKHGITPEKRDRTPDWWMYDSFFEEFGVSRISKRDDLSQILLLRNILTHRRGELRSTNEKEKLGNIQDHFQSEVDLSPEKVDFVFSVIRNVAFVIEDATHPYSVESKILSDFAPIDDLKKKKSPSK